MNRDNKRSDNNGDDDAYDDNNNNNITTTMIMSIMIGDNIYHFSYQRFSCFWYFPI